MYRNDLDSNLRKVSTVLLVFSDQTISDIFCKINPVI